MPVMVREMIIVIEASKAMANMTNYITLQVKVSERRSIGKNAVQVITMGTSVIQLKIHI